MSLGGETLAGEPSRGKEPAEGQYGKGQKGQMPGMGSAAHPGCHYLRDTVQLLRLLGSPRQKAIS